MNSASYYRARARELLGGNIFATRWLLALAACVICSAAISLISMIPFGTLLFEGFVSFGLIHVLLTAARSEKKEISIPELLAGKDKIADLLLLSVMKNLFLALWALVPIVGLIKPFSYAMTYYIKHDHPEYDWKRAITESRRMMDGYKWKYFCVGLSFFGWMIVGALTFGIGMLWIAPYMAAADACFYEDLKRLKDPTPAPEAEATAEPEKTEGETPAV